MKMGIPYTIKRKKSTNMESKISSMIMNRDFRNNPTADYSYKYSGFPKRETERNGKHKQQKYGKTYLVRS